MTRVGLSQPYIAAGRRQTDRVRRRLRALGPLARPLAIALTLPSWGLVSVLVALLALVQRHPLASVAVAVASAALGLALANA